MRETTGSGTMTLSSRTISAWPWAFILVGWLAFMATCHRPAEVSVQLISAANRGSFTESRFPLRSGGTWSLSQQRGKVVIVNLWAPWCPPCQRETPALVRTRSRFPSAELAVLGVVFDPGSEAAVDRFVSHYGVNYPIAKGTTSPAFQIALPTTLIYDRNGRLAAQASGALDEDSLVEALRVLFAEQS